MKDLKNFRITPEYFIPFSFLVTIITGTFLVEGMGAVFYAIKFVPLFGWGKGIWASVFQAVSAFCNAGMDVVGPNSNDNPFTIGKMDLPGKLLNSLFQSVTFRTSGFVSIP